MLTTKLTTKPRDLSGRTRTRSDETPDLTCENGRTQKASDRLDGIGNRVTCKGPWVQIPPPPLVVMIETSCQFSGQFPCPFAQSSNDPRSNPDDGAIRYPSAKAARTLNSAVPPSMPQFPLRDARNVDLNGSCSCYAR